MVYWPELLKVKKSSTAFKTNKTLKKIAVYHLK